jgi:hypothetical protein
MAMVAGDITDADELLVMFAQTILMGTVLINTGS